jgi:hypothetical protein
MKVKLKQDLTLTIKKGEVVNIDAMQYQLISQFVEIVKEAETETKVRKVSKKVIKEAE